MWARDERAHAAQQQQLVDQLGHDVLPRSGSGKTTTGSRNSGSAMFLICERDGMRTAGFYCPDEGRLRCLLVALQAAGPLRIGYGASPWVAWC